MDVVDAAHEHHPETQHEEERPEQRRNGKPQRGPIEQQILHLRSWSEGENGGRLGKDTGRGNASGRGTAASGRISGLKGATGV